MAKKLLLLFFLLIVIAPFAFSLLLNRATDIDVIISWGPQTQYAGTLVAKQEGMFRAQGLRVSLDYTSSNRRVMELVSKGRKQIGVLWGHLFLIHYNKNTSNSVVVAQIMPESSLMIIARKSKGIKKLTDLNNKKISVFEMGSGGFLKLAKVFLDEYNIKPSKFILQSHGINPILFGASDAMLIPDVGTLYSFFASGVDTSDFVRFYLKDYGFDIPDNVIIVNKDFLKKYPKNVEKYLTALKAGWDFTTKPNNYSRTSAIIQKYSELIETNSTHEQNLWILDDISKTLYSKNKQIMSDFIDKKQFDSLEDIYFRNQLISKKRNYDSIFYKEFVEKIIK